MEEIYDVVVVGGGPAGIGAAIAAGRRGARTALVERHPILGGMGTAALVNNFCNAYHDGDRFIIGGIFSEIRDELIARDALFVTQKLEPYNHHIFCEIAKRLSEEAGVNLYLGSAIGSALFEGDEASIQLEGRTLRAKVVVDASGDAIVAAAAGVTIAAREEGRKTPMPMNYCYLIGPANWDEIREQIPEIILQDLTGRDYLYLGPQPRLREWVKQARECGDLNIPRDRIAVAYSVPLMDEYISVNFGRVVVDDPADPDQFKAAEQLGMEQVREGERFFQKYVPGFRDAKVTEVGLQIGVRESRQIVGQYTLTGDDVLSCRQYDDAIAQSCYSVDIHEPESDKTTMIKLPDGAHYDIPLRCLIPERGPRNLIVAGRSISATQTAMSSFRVSPSVMAIGEAAGVTAALASRQDGNVANVSVQAVQEELLRHNAILC